MTDRKRMGRPRKPPLEQLAHSVTITVTPGVYGALRSRAAAQHFTIAQCARQILMLALEGEI